MATVEAPTRPQIRLHEGPFVNEPLTDFTKRRECPPDARRHRESARPTGPRVRPDHRRQAGQDQRQDQVPQSRQALADRRIAPEGRQGARGASHAGGACRLLPAGAGLRSKSAPACSSAWAICCASANLNSAPGWFSKSARTGPKPTPTSPRPSTSASTTPARRCAWPRTELPVQMPRRARHPDLHSAGRGRGDSAVEFSLRHHGRHDAGFDRQRQHRNSETFERLADHRGEVRRTAGRMRHAGRRGEFLSRRGRQLSAMPWWRIPRPATSPSPVRAKLASTSTRARPRRLPARSGSSARSSKWAARTPSSWMPTPTSTPPSKAWPRPHSASRARSARPARAPSSTSASTTSSWRS